MDQVAKDAEGLLDDKQDAGLFLDESSFLKKGNSSVGVQCRRSGIVLLAAMTDRFREASSIFPL